MFEPWCDADNRLRFAILDQRPCFSGLAAIEMTHTTPSEIGESVGKLIDCLPRPGEPKYLNLESVPGVRRLDCFGNVERHVASRGGSIQYGWCVWETPGEWIEGEFHAVWRSPLSELIDITPKVDGEQRILFIPDCETVDKGGHIANIPVMLTDDPRIKRRVHNGWLRRQGPDTEVVGTSFVTLRDRLEVGRNTRCPCGSQKKYKHCCMP